VNQPASSGGGAPDRSVPIQLIDDPLPPPPRNPLALPPARRPRSVRRTSSIDMTWPEGPGTPMRMRGRARDVATGADGEVRVLADDAMEASIGPERTIAAITCDPDRAGIGELVGARGGGGLRSAVDDALPNDRRQCTPLALLLDDIAGASLVGGFAWSRHSPEWMSGFAREGESPKVPIPRRTMIGICAGFRPGAATLLPDGTHKGGGHNVVPVPPLTDPDDAIGWHPLASMPEVAMRRARRMDVWREGDTYRIDAHFRDSCSDPELAEVAVHEYSIHATIDAAALVLTEVAAVPRVLPYSECPAAAPNVGRLVGLPLAQLRLGVLEMLKGIECCTHLNDALRALADVATLLAAVEDATAA
jgi:hypothetical protein